MNFKHKGFLQGIMQYVLQEKICNTLKSYKHKKRNASLEEAGSRQRKEVFLTGGSIFYRRQ